MSIDTGWANYNLYPRFVGYVNFRFKIFFV